ncbi:Ig-like domain-containing protein [Capnocytophaga canimorsus]|uniref:Ig-like domain-containing protein n=1 Tax=Capnocytophaga canimorsus TaxID=28188 RepID=UPI00385172C0
MRLLLTRLLFSLMLIATFNKAKAQCNPHDLKVLESTRISFADEVTKGLSAEIFVVVHSADAQYKATDENGMVYNAIPSATYPSTLSINVGVINAPRTFTITALKGNCEYQLPDVVTIGAQESARLSLRKIDEYCQHQGAVMYQVIGNGENPADYEYTWQMPDGTWSLPLDPTGVSSLSAGNYRFKATHKTDPAKTFEAAIDIISRVQPIVFDLETYGQVCDDKATIEVKVTSGLYPLYFSLYRAKNDGTFDLVRPSQTSPFFRDIERNDAQGNTYQVRVNDFCGGAAGFGNATTKSITIGRFERFAFNQIQGPGRTGNIGVQIQSIWGCDTDKMSITPSWEANFNPQKVLWDDSSIYPMTFNFTLTSPSGIVYPVTFTYNNKTELFEGLILARYRNGVGPWYFALKDNSTLRFPKEEGNWRVTNNSYTLCGQTYPLPDFDKYVGGMQHYMEQHVDLILDRDACGRPYLAARDKWYEFKDSYLVLEEYPNCYNPAEDGFVKNPRFGNGWVKGPFAHLRHDSGLVVVSKDKICLGTYKMKFVNQCGNEVVRTRTLTDPLVLLPEKIDGGLRINIHESCSSDKIGLRIRTGYESLFMQEVKLLSFDGDATQLPADVQIGQTLPEHYRIANAIYYLPDTPVGRYVFEATVADNTCSVTMKESVEVRPEPTVTYTLQPDGCNYKLVPSATKVRLNDNVTYVLQWYDPIQGIWTAAEKQTYHNNKFSFITEDRFYRYITVPLNGNYRSSGKFRIVRAVFTKKDDGILECLDTNNAQEFEIPGPTDPEKKIKIKQILGIRCASNTYQVAVIAEGGKPPFTYSITNIGGTSQNISSDDDNMFFNITPADGNTRYVFRVEDACGDADADAVTPAQFSANFKILANQPNYCTGVKGILSVPNIHPKITYRWYRADNPSATLSTSNVLKIDALSVDDFNNDYEVDISSTFAQTDVATCLNKTLSYRFIEGNSAIEDISSKGVDKQMCALQTENLNLNLKQELFPSVTTDGGIMEINGSIQIPHPYDVNLYKYVGSTLTVTYTIKNECGLSATATSTLTLNKQHLRLYSERDVLHFTKCSGTVTSVAELETFIKGKYLLNPSVVFQWFANSDMTTPLTFPITANKAVYFRLSVPGLYCESAKPHTLNINFFNDPTGGRTAHIEVCEGTSVGNMVEYALVQALAIHNSLRHNLKIYSYDRATGLRTSLHGDYLMLDPSLELQYRYEVDGCTSADYYPFSYTLIKGPQVENRLKLYVCSGEEITGAMAYAKLREKYPNATTIDIRLTNGNYYVKDSSNEKLERYVSYSYTLQETNICRSLRAYLWFEDAEKTQKPAQANLTLCTGATLSEVKGALPGNNVHIYKDDVLVTDLTEPISAMATYRYTNTNANQCESDKSTVLITLQPLTTIVGNTDILLCETEAINQIITLGGTFSGMGTPTGLPMGITASFTANEITLSGVPTVVGTYTYSIPLTGTCGTHSVVTATIRVKAKPQKPIIVEHTPATCTSVQMLKISNYNPLATYHNLPAGSSIDNQGVIVGLTDATSTYGGIIAQVEGCESEPSDTFTILAKLPTADAPSVTNQTLCSSTDTATFVATPTAGHTLRWYDTATSPTHLTATPTVSRNVTVKTIFTKYVSQVNAEGCESGRVPVTITIDDTQAPTIGDLADLTISCQATDIDNQVNNWLSTIAITDACGSVATTTNNYQAVKPTHWCNVSGNTVTVTITSTDTFGNTATKTVFIKLVTIDAVNDNFGVVQANTTTTGSVLDNDKLGTASTTTANVEIQNVVSPHTGITISTTDGKVSVANNVPSGVYTLTYTICEKVNGTPCDTAKVNITVQNGIVADDDDLGTVVSGGTTTQTVISNDKLNGTPVVIGTEVGKVTLTPIITPTGITIDATNGKVSVGNNVPSGVYTLTYKICENGAIPDNCDDATVTITVQNGIVAEDDDLGPVVSGGTTTQTVISNDKLNGTPVVIGAGTGEVTLTPLITPTGITIDGDGKVTVGTNVSSGVYTLTYKICENGATPDNCDDATVTITVQNSIVADGDDLGTVVSGGTTTQTVISNDKLNGTPVVIGTGVGEVTLTPIITPTGITLNGDGKVTVGTNVSSGVYTLTYKICENGATPDNCDDATVTVTVQNGIVADNDDLGTVVSGGTTTQTVISNDKLNGTPVVIGTGVGEVTLTPIITPTGITIDATNGKVSVGNNVSSGVYTLTYKICENGATPDNCDDATVTITVENSIVADEDDLGLVVSGGTTTQTVISNDKLNGTPVVIGTGVGQVTLTPLITPTGITIDATNGKVTVGTNVSSGVYTLTYKICENGATPDNCDDATVTITVQNGIVADNDDLGLVVSGGTTTQTVISNDKLNGTPVVIGTGVGQVTLTPIITPTGITIDATNGKVTVGTNVSSGVYTLTYKICENGATPDNCDDATVTITVENSIVADEDDLGLVVSGGTTTQTVISNDKLNGTPVVIGTGVGQVTLTPLITPTGITIDTTNGKVSVGNNVPSGVYTLTYKICENGATPDNCDTATVTITVLSSNTVLAISDINNTYLNTSVSGNVSTNDEDPQGDALEFSLLTASNDQGHSLVFNSDGTYVFTPKEGFTGVVVYEYEVCDKGMPRACATATLTIGVFSQPHASANTVFANDDAVRTKVGTPVLISVLANDIDVEGDTFEITSHPSHTSYGSLSLSNGKLTYTPNAGYVGVDSFTYTICDNRTTDKACSTATVRVLILSDTSSNTTFANDDAYNGDKNRVISGNVLSNDVDLEGNGQTTTLLSGATKGVVSLNADGTFSYKPNMGYVGPDSFTYKLCDDGTPEACAVATVYLTVNEAESIVANNDDFTNTPIRNMVGGVLGSVLTNDTYLGVPISSGQVSGVTLLSDGGLTGVTLDGSGHLTIPQGATEGTYTLTYEVCEKSKGSCATAEIYVRIIKGCPLNFYNGLSNNEDGTNDGFVIDGIECYPKNKVRIYNRWGVKVFETEGYNNKERLFKGISNGRVTVDADKKLPQGTYYYVIEYIDGSNQTHSEAGWLYIKR